MALIADTGPLVALYDAQDRHHEAVRALLQKGQGAMLVPAPILTEVDYLLRKFLGVDAALDFLAGFRAGSFTYEAQTRADLERCAEIMSEYRTADIGLADASIVALAERRNVYRVLTIDERDFRLLRPRSGQAFTLLPADESH